MICAKPTVLLFTMLLMARLAVAAAGADQTLAQAQDVSVTNSKGVDVGPDYIIGASDGIEVYVWKEPDLSAKIPVRPDGKISLPLLGDVRAAGFTPTQLADDLSMRFKKYVADPRVDVVVTAVNSHRIYIMGEVAHTGSFPLSGNMTVLQALASAGGFSQFANLKGIYILRNENGAQIRLRFNYKKVIKGKNMQQNISLKSGDTIVVP